MASHFTARRDYRHPVVLQVQEINGEPAEDAVLRNLNPYGTLLEAPVALQVGDTIHFSVVLPDEEDATRVCGKVVWTCPDEATPPRSRVGLSFLTPQWHLPIQTVNLWSGLSAAEKQALSVTLH